MRAGRRWFFLLLCGSVCACADGSRSTATSARALTPCEQTADALEREVAGRDADVEMLMASYENLFGDDGNRQCDNAVMARAARALLALLEDDRVISERPLAGGGTKMQ